MLCFQLFPARPLNRVIEPTSSELFGKLLFPFGALDNRDSCIRASVRHLLDCWQPALLRRQTSSRVGDHRNHLFRISNENRRDGCHVGVRVVGITRAIATEQEPGPLRCVLRLLLLLGHRSRQFFDGDRQLLE